MSFILTYRSPKSVRASTHDRTAVSNAQLKLSPERPTLLSYEALPEWLRDNPFMRTGYRDATDSSLGCFQSWGFLHNETMNIYTHLVPALTMVFAQAGVQVLITKHFPSATLLDRLVFTVNMLAAITCWTLSTLYHTLMNHSVRVSLLWLRIDYVGIITLILGSFFSGVHVGFYCEPALRNTYWTMIITLSAITSVLVLHPQLQGLPFRPHRTGAFVTTGLSGFAPIIHGIVLYGWDEMWVRSGMPYFFLEGTIYCLGALIFATRMPESIWPGKFDIWLGSHQIFHILVVIASITHMYGVWQAFEWNYRSQHGCL